MKRFLLSVMTVILLLMMLVSCTNFVPLTPEQIQERIAQAEGAMSEGNHKAAEAFFNQVLKTDPENGEANLGMGLIWSMQAQKNILDIAADYLTLAEDAHFRSADSSKLARVARAVTRLREFTNNPRSVEFSKLQSEIADIVELLESAKHSMKIALETMPADSTMKLFPNAFDWNEDGYTDSTMPLNLKTDVEGESRVWWLLFSYRPEFPMFSSTRGLFNDTIRGDAWFDKQTIDYLLDTGEIPEDYEPVFDDDDHYTLDATAVKGLLTVVNMGLSIFEPFIIWDIDPDPELTNYIELYSDTQDQYDGFIDFATSTLDTDQNGTITNAEFRRVLPENFMAFYNDANGGANAITDLRSAIVDLCELLVELSDMGMIDFVLPEFIEELEEIKELITVPSAGEPQFINLYNFFESPNNFSDLKVFIPDVGYDTEGLNIIWPDPTFGGLIEVLE